jgi:hypothetical protein
MFFVFGVTRSVIQNAAFTNLYMNYFEASVELRGTKSQGCESIDRYWLARLESFCVFVCLFVDLSFDCSFFCFAQIGERCYQERRPRCIGKIFYSSHIAIIVVVVADCSFE